ncbi:MAG: hypothetical protein U9N52_09050 [Campylobacterota bacterium]|nr:hypothetical protein [Campylobacterota bacterium]
MKLSLALSALLVGGSLFMSGCGSDSSSSDGNTTSSQAAQSSSEAAVQAPQFTTEMLAGKTFYSYSRTERQGGNVEYHDGTVVIFSNNASTVSSQDGSISNIPVTLAGDAMSLVLPDGNKKFLLLGSSESYLILIDDYGEMLWSTSEQADNAQALFETIISEQTITQETFTAHPWYSLDWAEADDGRGVLCHALFTYHANGTADASYIDNGEVKSMVGAMTYSVENNKHTATYMEEGELKTSTYTPLLVSENRIIWTHEQALFKNRADAVAFSELFKDSSCNPYFPEQP